MKISNNSGIFIITIVLKYLSKELSSMERLAVAQLHNIGNICMLLQILTGLSLQ